jgi:uncharacterized protein (TIGR02145 family)
MKKYLTIIISIQTIFCLDTFEAQLFGGQIISPDLVTYYPSGSVFCASGPTQIVEVTNPSTGKTWMDRNLGASQVASSLTDALAYGDLYQWGRRSDGHQCRTSPLIYTLSQIDVPAHGSFIVSQSPPNDWRSPQNSNLWQGVNGINNPCPLNFRIPTQAEMNSERTSWSTNNSSGAFNSPLKFSNGGDRIDASGILNQVGTNGYYWTSTTSSTFSYYMRINSSTAIVGTDDRAFGCSVRCIKN